MSYRIKSFQIPGTIPKQFIEGGRPHYNAGISLEADNPSELDAVDFVDYELHPTFKDRHLTGRNRSNNFEVRIWSWGFFNAKAKVVLKNGAPEMIEGMVRW